MSDYAGPVLGAVGAVVGGYFGGAAGARWGWAIGSAIGGAYAQSQQVLPGPKIGDVQKQTSQEGGFRPIVYGRSHPIAGNIIADGGPVIVTRRERQGKGGPKVESESAYRTYAVGVCEGEATLLQAWRNGILVYDAEDGSMAAENAAFLEYATWYTGSFDQSASPDLEEVYGAGQAPYFRGTAYLSIHNEDVTDQRGAWSQWQFRVFRGAAKSYTTPPYPVLVLDSIDTDSHAINGAFRDLPAPVDDLAVSSFALDGVLRDLIGMYEVIDPVQVTSRALNSQLRSVILPYSVVEDIQVTSQTRNGELYVVVIQYLNYEPEKIQITSRALNGTHA